MWGLYRGEGLKIWTWCYDSSKFVIIAWVYLSSLWGLYLAHLVSLQQKEVIPQRKQIYVSSMKHFKNPASRVNWWLKELNEDVDKLLGDNTGTCIRIGVANELY